MSICSVEGCNRESNGTILRGEKAPWAKLTESDVIAIRAVGMAEPHEKLAEQFGVSRSQIDRIVRRERWSHI